MIIEVDSQFKNEKIYSSEKAYNVFLKAFEVLDEIDKEKEHFFCMHDDIISGELEKERIRRRIGNRQFAVTSQRSDST